jgi:ABC-2 type transport system ATP-binding protein
VANPIEAEGLVKRYGSISALKGLTLTVREAEVFGFLGPNGAGKTTAVKLLVGLCRPTSGRATVLGRPIGDREARRSLGYLPELFRYQGWLSAREVLRLHAELAGMAATDRRRAVMEAMDMVGLGARADDRVETFSKGMQQRLGLAVALLGNPRLVFLDEPTSALDPVGRHEVRTIIRELRERGTTVFLNSHLLSEVEQICDRVAVVDRGRVIVEEAIGGPEDATSRIRIRLTNLPDPEPVLARFGPLERSKDWYTVGAPADAAPAIVRALVQAGADIHEVERIRPSLEDRFLGLLEQTESDPE